MGKYIEKEKFAVDNYRILTDIDLSDRKAVYLKGISSKDLEKNYKKATRDNIIKHIKWLSEDTQAGDSLLFVYSGHGSSMKNQSGSESDGMDEVLISQKGKAIKDNKLNEELIQPLVEG